MPGASPANNLSYNFLQHLCNHARYFFYTAVFCKTSLFLWLSGNYYASYLIACIAYLLLYPWHFVLKDHLHSSLNLKYHSIVKWLALLPLGQHCKCNKSFSVSDCFDLIFSIVYKLQFRWKMLRDYLDKVWGSNTLRGNKGVRYKEF